jgi:hypothetical protein
MNIIVCTPLNTLHTALARKLLPQGYNLVKLNTLDEIEASIPVRSKIAFIDDGGFDIKELLHMVARIKKKLPGFRLTLLTRTSEMQLIKVFIQLGVDMVVQSSLHLDTIAERFSGFLQKVVLDHRDRRFVRIKPADNEVSTLQFLIYSRNIFVTGKITDVSMGGVAAKFSSSEIEMLSPDEIFKNAKINLGKKSIQADVKLQKKGKDVAAFSFERMRVSFQDSLSEYIYFKSQTLP